MPEAEADIDSCRSAPHQQRHGQRLVRFMQFLTSGTPSSRQLLKQFRASHAECPKSRTCSVCNGHCLIDELKHAI
jgi:hypothetical protein